MFIKPADLVIRSGITKGMNVGDFGVGAGAYLSPLLEAVSDEGSVYGIDIQRNLVGRLESDARLSEVPNITFLQGDLECLYGSKLADGMLDFTIASNILFQVKKKTSFIEEIKRTLRPGGKLLLVDWVESFSHIGPHPDQVIAFCDAQVLCRNAGFRYIQCVWQGPYHYGIVYEKPPELFSF